MQETIVRQARVVARRAYLRVIAKVTQDTWIAVFASVCGPSEPLWQTRAPGCVSVSRRKSGTVMCHLNRIVDGWITLLSCAVNGATTVASKRAMVAADRGREITGWFSNIDISGRGWDKWSVAPDRSRTFTHSSRFQITITSVPKYFNILY